jgi:hypothetical protein
MSVILNLSQLRQAVTLLEGAEDSTLTIKELQDGVYAWSTDYPEEGSVRLSAEPTLSFEDKVLEDAFTSMINLLEHYDKEDEEDVQLSLFDDDDNFVVKGV